MRLLEENFKKYPHSSIIMGVPNDKYFSDGDGAGERLDVMIRSSGDIGYMFASDDMQHFNRLYPSYKRIYWHNLLVGGKLL